MDGLGFRHRTAGKAKRAKTEIQGPGDEAELRAGGAYFEALKQKSPLGQYRYWKKLRHSSQGSFCQRGGLRRGGAAVEQEAGGWGPFACIHEKQKDSRKGNAEKLL